MTKTTLYITRHGQTQWNVEKRMQGHADSPLTDLGVQQAQWLRDALEHVEFAAIYTSPNLRAYRTADIVRGKRDLQLIPNELFREIGLGTWEGLLTSDIKQAEPEEFFAFWNEPRHYQAHNGGETYLELQTRIIPVVTELLAKHTGETILIVTHAMTLKTILNHFEQRPLERFWGPPVIHPTSLSKVSIENAIPMIELYADVSHHRIPSSSPILEKSSKRIGGSTP